MHKKEYQTPRLEKLGSAAEMTQHWRGWRQPPPPPRFDCDDDKLS